MQAMKNLNLLEKVACQSEDKTIRTTLLNLKQKLSKEAFVIILMHLF